MALSPQRRALLLMVLTAMVWAGLFPAGKIALRSIPPFTLAAIRLTIGAILLFIYLQRKQGPEAANIAWTPRLVGSFLFLGLIGYLFSVGGSYQGLRLTTATNAALLNAASPIAIALLAVLFLKEKLSSRMLRRCGHCCARLMAGHCRWPVQCWRSHYYCHPVCLGHVYNVWPSSHAAGLTRHHSLLSL